MPSASGASTIRNRSHGGVIRSRFRASAKNVNASSIGNGDDLGAFEDVLGHAAAAR